MFGEKFDHKPFLYQWKHVLGLVRILFIFHKDYDGFLYKILKRYLKCRLPKGAKACVIARDPITTLYPLEDFATPIYMFGELKLII